MSISRISVGLNTLFEKQMIVFWHDVEAEFSSIVDDLQLDDVQLVWLDETPALRINLELDDGVQVNYGKFGDLSADVKVVTGGAGDE